MGEKFLTALCVESTELRNVPHSGPANAADFLNDTSLDPY
jgi:hypothetical protein